MKTEIELKLKELKEDKKWIALSLYPPNGETIIQDKGNRLFINQGRSGEFICSEKDYNLFVDKYDSRN